MPCTYYCKTVYSVHCFWCRPNLFQSWVLIPSLLTSSKFANDQFWLVLFFADDVVGNGRRAVFQKRSPPEEKRLPNEASFNQWYQSHILATLIQAKLYLTDTTYTYQKNKHTSVSITWKNDVSLPITCYLDSREILLCWHYLSYLQK